MALKCEPQNLNTERLVAERYRDRHLEHLADMIDEYSTPAFRDSNGESDYQPENHAYEYAALMVPRLVFHNPRVSMKSGRGGRYRMVARAMEHGTNRWIKNVELYDTLQRLAYWQLFMFGAALTTQVPQPGVNPRNVHGLRWPCTEVLSPRQFLFDPLCRWFGSARWVGHSYVRDKDDLLKEAEDDPKAGWNRKLLREMEGGAPRDFRKNHGPKNHDLDRNELVFTEIWVPEKTDGKFTPERGYHGTIYTVCEENIEGEGGKDDWVREPRPFYGPRWGPYAMFGTYAVPDSPFPLSPLVATRGQVKELNEHARAASRSAAQYKRIIFTGNETLAKRMAAAPDSFVFCVPGLLKDEVITQEVAGISPQQVQTMMLLRDRLDRNSGISEAQRGNSTAGTATANAIAAEAAQTRTAFVAQRFGKGVEQVLRTGAWYLYHDDRVLIPLGEDAEQTLGIEDPVFKGGTNDESKGMTFDDLDLNIDPYSMPHETDAMLQQRALQRVQLITGLAPMVPQTPWVDWQQVLDNLGDAFNDRDLASVIDVGKAEQAAQQAAQMQAQQQQPPKQIKIGTPRLQREYGNAAGGPSGAFAGNQGKGRGQGAPYGQGRPAANNGMSNAKL